MFPHALLSAR